jgi:hypothetical protein
VNLLTQAEHTDGWAEVARLCEADRLEEAADKARVLIRRYNECLRALAPLPEPLIYKLIPRRLQIFVIQRGAAALAAKEKGAP